MIQTDRPFTLDRIVRLGISLALFMGFIWLIGYLSDVLIPFVVALLIAYMINPLVILLQKKITNRNIAVLFALLIVFLVLSLVALMIIPMIVKELVHMSEILTQLVNNSNWTERAAEIIPPDLWKMLKEYAGNKEVQEILKTGNFWTIAGTVASKVLPGTWGIIMSTASFIFGLVGILVIFLYLVFILIDYDAISKKWKDLIPQTYKEMVVTFVSDFDSSMNSYFRAQALVASIVGILFSIGFGIIGLPMGILLGLLVGLLNMVPYLQILGLIPAFLLALVHSLETGGNFWMIVGMTGSVFAVVQVIQDTVLVPKIMGKVTGLKPAIIMLSLSVWGKLIGFLGLIIALPLTCILLSYYKNIVVKKDILSSPDQVSEISKT